MTFFIQGKMPYSSTSRTGNVEAAVGFRKLMTISTFPVYFLRFRVLDTIAPFPDKTRVSFQMAKGTLIFPKTAPIKSVIIFFLLGGLI